MTKKINHFIGLLILSFAVLANTSTTNIPGHHAVTQEVYNIPGHHSVHYDPLNIPGHH